MAWSERTDAEKHAFAKWLYQLCINLKDGEAFYNESEERIQRPVNWNFNIHYQAKHSCWYLYWHKPKEDNLGLVLPTPQHLWAACLNNLTPEMEKNIIRPDNTPL